MSKKLVVIAIVASVVTTPSPAIYLGMPWLIICIAAFPIVFGATFVFVYFGDRIFHKFSLGKVMQLLLILPSGFLGGVFIYLLLFMKNIMGSGIEALSMSLITQYGLLGLYAAFVTWLIYNLGPFRVEPYHSNKRMQSDHTKATPLRGG